MTLSAWKFAVVLAIAGCAPAKTLRTVPESEALGRTETTASTAGIVERRSLQSALLNEGVTYHVYLPQMYAMSTDRLYPVVYWLHGSGGYPPGVLEMLASRFHHAMDSGQMHPAIIVFPDGFEGTMWANAADGTRPVEDMIVKELVPHIDAEFRTQAIASGRLLEGASMGGYGAARLGLLYPDIFGAISMINPGPMQPVLDPEDAPIVGRAKAQATLDQVFGGDTGHFERQSPWNLATSFAKRNCSNTKIRMLLGKSDPMTPTNLDFSRRLEELRIAHELELVVDADHDPKAMFANLKDDYWDFFGLAFNKNSARATECH
ncbi:alpha/beta hydrolase [Qipengyuania sp. CAU 1752]